MIRARDVALGDELPPLRKVVTGESVKAYADAGGDQNPLHQDDEAARAAGFPGVIAHGMFTMAHLVTCITNWTGDPAALKRIRAQFRAPVFMGETMEAGGRVAGKDPSGRVVLDVWVTVERDGATEYPIKKSRAELLLPA